MNPALFYTFVSLVCFSSTPLFIKFFAQHLDAWTVNGLRYAIAALCYLPFLVHACLKSKVESKVWLHALIPASASLLAQIGWAFTPYYNDASIISFVARSLFLFTIVIGFIFLPGERWLAREKRFWVGVCLCLFGILVMYFESTHTSNSSTFGIGLLLVVCVLYGFYAVFVKMYMSEYPAHISFGIVSLYNSSILLVLTFCFGNYHELEKLDLNLWSWLVLSAIVGIAMAHGTMYRAIQGIGPVIYNSISNIGPFLSALAAYFILAERMTPYQWVGGVIMIFGTLVLAALSGRQKH